MCLNCHFPVMSLYMFLFWEGGDQKRLSREQTLSSLVASTYSSMYMWLCISVVPKAVCSHLPVSSQRPNSSTKMKPPPRCSAWGPQLSRLPARPRRPAAQIALPWAGAATTAAAALPPQQLSDHLWQRNHAGTTGDAHPVTLYPSTSQVRSAKLRFSDSFDSLIEFMYADCSELQN